MEKIQAEEKFGPYLKNGNLHVNGFWHLYRQSLTQNNRHNTFHWADLYRLDLYPNLKSYSPKYTARSQGGEKRIALVLGASSPDKHPKPAFWIALARQLMQASFMPFLLGGKKEEVLGETVANAIQVPKANLCGKLGLTALANLVKTVDLCITPDTGPMHLANWLGIPILNLSMGPVRAYETGPYSPNQTILWPNMSCAGCWQCHQRHFACKKKFHPQAVTNIAVAILKNQELAIDPKLIAAKTCLDELGIANLELYNHKPNAQQSIDLVWRNFFLGLINPNLLPKAKDAMQVIAQNYPKVYEHIHQKLKTILQITLHSLNKADKNFSLSYHSVSPSLRLWIGFLEMYLQNNNFSRESLKKVCSWLALSLELLTF